MPNDLMQKKHNYSGLAMELYLHWAINMVLHSIA